MSCQLKEGVIIRISEKGDVNETQMPKNFQILMKCVATQKICIEAFRMNCSEGLYQQFQQYCMNSRMLKDGKALDSHSISNELL